MQHSELLVELSEFQQVEKRAELNRTRTGGGWREYRPNATTVGVSGGTFLVAVLASPRRRLTAGRRGR